LNPEDVLVSPVGRESSTVPSPRSLTGTPLMMTMSSSPDDPEEEELSSDPDDEEELSSEPEDEEELSSEPAEEVASSSEPRRRSVGTSSDRLSSVMVDHLSYFD
jgi:hypothetical protein